jgi:D-alanyl-D-alanine carboxypeptidase
MKKTIQTILLCSIISINMNAQNYEVAKLNTYFKELAFNNKFMGSVSVSQNGQHVYTKTVGMADVQNNKESNPLTKFRIGSISKTFTATIILKAVEEGKINLSEKIITYFPSIPNAKNISISNLLNHRSGIYNFTNDEKYLTYNTKALSEREMVAIISKSASEFPPDSTAAYSNSNYVLLSYLLEKVYKKPFAKILTETIVLPFGLHNTSVGKTIDIKNNEAFSYSFSEKWIKETETDMSIPMGAGNIISTPMDVNIFINSLFNGKIISEKSLSIMKTIKDNYGSGLFEMPFNKSIGYGHTGGIDGFSSVFCYFPESKISYSLMSNGSNYENNNISLTVLNFAHKLPFEIPSFKTIIVSKEILDSYVGVYGSTEMPLKITITNNNNILHAQATGQSKFDLEALAPNIFQFSQAGIILQFDAVTKTMKMQQAGRKFTFTKE